DSLHPYHIYIKRVVESVRDNDVIAYKLWYEHAAVGVKSCRIQDGIFHTQKIGYLPFQLFMDILCAADKTDGRHTITMGINRILSGLNYLRMTGKSKVVVSTKVKHSFSVCSSDFCTLWRSDYPLPFEQSGIFYFFYFLL